MDTFERYAKVVSEMAHAIRTGSFMQPENMAKQIRAELRQCSTFHEMGLAGWLTTDQVEQLSEELKRALLERRQALNPYTKLANQIVGDTGNGTDPIRELG